jgi:nucleotide-binding universal stress UspA family protein
MYNSILLAAALQRWERYSAHAIAARDVAAALARHAKQLYVLSVYDNEATRLPSSGLPAEMVAQLREQHIQQTDRLVAEKMDQYVAPLVSQGLAVSKILRLGSPRHVIVEVASEVGADLLVIGSHSKRGLLDIAVGDTARHVSTHASCEVVMVVPKK